MIYLELFLTFLKIGGVSIGGGYVILPLIQNEMVEGHKWLSVKEFADLVTIAEMTPGPIAINSATFVGVRVGGFWGACVATLGCILPALFIVSIAGHFYYKYKNLSGMQGVLGVIRAVVVVLIGGAALKIFILMAFKNSKFNLREIDFLALSTFAVALFVLRKFKLNPILVMLACGIIRILISAILDFAVV